ncbi:zinc finger protein 135 [Austrofundulus limnaeus]|uniref:Zinc finger protein 135 n=1 Tax=Austrofundulus limnaeus TaxID=52670 RepID=A0A2I4B042_AUSLI|nr:PREDICTED: zinc finger protein 135-like [Austrofundulus limnaeus]
MDVKNSTMELTLSPATCAVKEEPEDPNGNGFVQELLVESINTPVTPHCSNQSEECVGDSRDLEVHNPKHTGERKFICTQCDKRFIRSSHLKDHLCVHTGEKPYACTQCEKRFTQSSSLKRHQHVHSR